MKVSAYTNSDSLCRWIFDFANFGIILTDNDLKITDANQWIENHSARQKVLLNGNSIFQVFPEIIERGLDQHLIQALSGASVVLSAHFHSYLLRFPHQDGNEIMNMQQNVEISPLLEKSKVTGLLIFIEDVTERLNREVMLQQRNDELQKLNSTKDKFFSILSHDLRSPFTALLGLSEILIENENLTKEEVKNIVKMLYTSLKNEYDLLENLLKWSQLQSGRFDLDLHELNLNELIQGITEIAVPVANSKNIKITSEIPGGLTVISDSKALTTVLHNLIFNALKYTRKGGTVQITAFRSAESIIISVKDNGIGIPAEKINSLFRIEEHVSTPGTENEKGSGLGLILVKELIDKLNGEIWVRSQPEAGSTFYVSLPLTI